MKIMNLLKCSYVSLVKDKMKSFLSILGIIIGVLTVVTVLSISQAGKAYVMKEINKVGLDLMWVTVDSNRAHGLSLELDDIEPLKRLSFIKDASPYIVTAEQVKKNGREGTVTVIGVNATYQTIRSIQVNGRFINNVDSQENSRVCVISDAIRKKYLNETLDPCGNVITLNGMEYTVVGYLPPSKDKTQTGLDEDNAIYIPYSTFGQYYSSERIDMYIFSVDSVSEINKYKMQIQQALIGTSQKVPIKIGNVYDSAKNMQFLFNIVTCVTILITAVSLLVSGIGIMNVLLMSIAERKWEIGLRKALGADNRSILLQFLMESLLLCITGALIGLLISKGAIIVLSYFIKINIELSFFAVCVSVSFCCLIGLFFGIFPAMKAAKFEPLECLEQ